MKQLVCVACIFLVPLCACALDREAFTFKKYDLNVHIEPEQQRLGVRGTITLRNDSGLPQRSLSLQISSTLSWRSITLSGRPIEFVTQPYISDIDHTGALSEAVVVLPQPLAPDQAVELEIGYEGIIPQDITRLTRIGTPADAAKHSDWDEISRSFTAVRGIGYVAWYPIATEAVSLEDSDSLERAVGRWKSREAGCEMKLYFTSTSSATVLFSGAQDPAIKPSPGDDAEKVSSFTLARLGFNVPTFVSAAYQTLSQKNAGLEIYYLPDQRLGAQEYAEVGSQPDVANPLGTGSPFLQILGLPDLEAAPFATKGMLLTPLRAAMTNDALLNLVYAKARDSILSTRAWITEGLARYAQAALVESLQSREAAIAYMGTRLPNLVESEKSAARKPSDSRLFSLMNDPEESELQTKAMYVWWMLRDMAGPADLQNALSDYKEADDTTRNYMENLITSRSHRDLHWFFEDWVYHDRGLPDFRIASVYPSQMPGGGYLVTVTVENLGAAGAEVPVSLRAQSSDVSKRLIVPAKSTASIRIEAPSMPQQVTVNDGSVPESDVTNNQYTLNH